VAGSVRRSAASATHGELLSLLFFDREFTRELIKLMKSPEAKQFQD